MRIMSNINRMLSPVRSLSGMSAVTPTVTVALIDSTSLNTGTTIDRKDKIKIERIEAETSDSVRIALAVPAGLAFFLLFPRLATPLWGIPETTLDSKSGLSDSMSPGDIQKMFMDDSPAFRVVFDGPVPPAERRYWRGPVLWETDGRHWSAGLRPLQSRPDASVRPAPVAYEVTLEPTGEYWLFGLDPRHVRFTGTAIELNTTMPAPGDPRPRVTSP